MVFGLFGHAKEMTMTMTMIMMMMMAIGNASGLLLTVPHDEAATALQGHF